MLPLELGKSQRKLFTAFVELRKEKATEKITVVELCEKAGVNRSTFYRSYYDIFDIAEKLGEYCANAVISFCADFCYGYAEGLTDLNSVLIIPKFDNTLAVDGLFVLRDERKLLECIFEKLMEVFNYFVPEGCSKEDEIRFKSAYQFAITGAILICGGVQGEKSADTIFETSKITFYIVKNCIEFLSGEKLLPNAPIDESESVGIPKKKERLNVRKTKRSLKRAFQELLKKKPLEKITISELCEKAEISCSTFYTHYNSIEDFINSIDESIMDQFWEIAQTIYFQSGNEQLAIGDLLSYIDSNQSLFSLLVSEDSVRAFTADFPHKFSGTVFEMIDKDFDCPLFDSRTALDFVCNAAWGMLFDPFSEHDLSSAQIFRIAYDVFLLLFKKRDGC